MPARLTADAMGTASASPGTTAPPAFAMLAGSLGPKAVSQSVWAVEPLEQLVQVQANVGVLLVASMALAIMVLASAGQVRHFGNTAQA